MTKLFRVFTLSTNQQSAYRARGNEIDKEEKIYLNLRKHLDRLPVSYPSTESGVELRILKHLFTPQEAKIATQLSMIQEPVERIYERVKRSGLSIVQLQVILDEMVHKGSILGRKKGDKTLYRNAPLSLGMYEFQVDRLPKNFAEDWLQYLDEAYAHAQYKTGIPQLRTVPVGKSIPLPEKYQVSDYDNVKKLVENAPGPIAVSNCICRQVKDLAGQSCTTTELRETCLIITPDEAEYFINVGIGRLVTKEEAFDILEKAQEAGLVLQPINSQRPEAICCCCGDCCEILLSVKKFPRPSDLYASNYYAEVDPEICTGCQICVQRCQLEAAVMSDFTATINLHRCIGCGNCVVSCEPNAIQLKKKEQEVLPPKDMIDLQMKILSRKVGKLGLLKVAAKMMLKQKV